MRFENRVVVVTGAASGIGAATAALFAREGAKVMVADVASPASVVGEIQAHGGHARGLQGDVSTSEGAGRLIGATIEAWGRLDVLVNNAGVGCAPRPIEQVPEDEWDRTFAINVKSGYLCARAALPQMRKAGSGVILFTASIAGIEGVMGLAPYAASKAAVINLARTLALDHAGDGIRVNVICPGATDTAMLRGVPVSLDAMAANLPLRRLVQPGEIAEGFAYLASDAARSVTGHVLVIDAGYTAGDFKLGAPAAQR